MGPHDDDWPFDRINMMIIILVTWGGIGVDYPRDRGKLSDSAHSGGQSLLPVNIACSTMHNVYFVKYDVTVSFLAQVLDTVTYFVSQVLDTAS